MRGKSSFIFSNPEHTHTITIRKWFHWWYLLPLLLLLLLIKCEKTTKILVIDAVSSETLMNSKIDLKIENLNFEQACVNDNEPKCEFVVGKYPIYKLLFDDDINAVAIVSHEGYLPKIVNPKFGWLRKKINIVELNKIQDPRIVVIDSLTREPISGVNLTLQTESQSFDEISNTDGKVIFNYQSFDDNEEVIVSTHSTNYEDVRKYYKIEMPKMINDTIALLSIDDGGLKGERGDITINLSWNTTDDLDLILEDPCGNEIYFKEREQECGDGIGYLDLDANSADADDDSLTTTPQENIYWNTPSAGKYIIKVYFYKKRELDEVPYKLTIIQKDKRNIIDTIATELDNYVLSHEIIIPE